MIRVDYFSDLLCVWAYGGQIRLDELIHRHGDQIELQYRFISIFAAAHSQIEKNWQHQDGYLGFNRHLQEVASQWSHVNCHDKLWLDCQPSTSTSAHLVLKAVDILQQRQQISSQRQVELGNRSLFEHLMWSVREAFFAHGVDISRLSALREIVIQAGLDWQAVFDLIDNGEAFAGLYQDDQQKQQFCLQGSPSYVLNEGRQILYGNVGYKIIESNIEELLHRQQAQADASWC